MRFLWIVGMMLLSSPAAADISDSGQLTIGGQAIIVGSMTVQASTFSVGGSTFVVAQGSVTLGGRLNLAASGLKFADGTTQTTASVSSWNLAFASSTATTTVTSTSFGDIAGTSHSLTTGGNSRLLISGSFPVQINNSSSIFYARIMVDGVALAEVCADRAEINSHDAMCAFSNVPTSILSAGSHDVKLQGRVDGGVTATLGTGAARFMTSVEARQ